jgi:hypothetical protein
VRISRNVCRAIMRADLKVKITARGAGARP